MRENVWNGNEAMIDEAPRNYPLPKNVGNMNCSIIKHNIYLKYPLFMPSQISNCFFVLILWSNTFSNCFIHIHNWGFFLHIISTQSKVFGIFLITVRCFYSHHRVRWGSSFCVCVCVYLLTLWAGTYPCDK